ncbi:hypothetical protein [Undibacterium sp. CCC1.1]|uniref:hypothetical protein n=1 Tax=Undibacterium sp. CCC1.1 TaxID=3048602 RepID=UPI002B236B22|nr:hypothetical protein [Undibacterium sp. CCC1.1]MEB0216760.1 hypothetical protein [Undibacterium sp. 5I2]
MCGDASKAAATPVRSRINQAIAPGPDGRMEMALQAALAQADLLLHRVYTVAWAGCARSQEQYQATRCKRVSDTAVLVCDRALRVNTKILTSGADIELK